MYFKKLELLGFKSFCDKTILHFEPGITAIVGPNGCGKSNIFDSMRWVLGEQSIKELRGSQSQDVIFNGSDSKEPLSMAEVTLTFDNANRFFAFDHDELAITRRLFRSGESEYLINKNQVRLKDIMDILLGTGIGAESYSLVQQGKIDLVLSSRPEDRRLVFDEASGITKYKAQKREALRKLEETEQNLLRVNDIIVEVKRQIGSLERQANKARRYKEVFEELKNSEVALASLQKESLKKLKENIAAELTQLELKESELLGTIREVEEKISSRQSELKGLEQEISSLKDKVFDLESQAAISKERIGYNQERILELGTRKEFLTEQHTQIEKRLALDEEKLNVVRQEYAAIRNNIEEKTTLLKGKEQELLDLADCIKASFDNIAKAKKSVLDIVGKTAAVKNAITDLQSKQQVHGSRKKRLEIEKAKINEERAAVQIELDTTTLELQELEKVFLELSGKINNIKSGLENEIVSLGAIDSDLSELERKDLSLLSQKEFLEKLKVEYDGIGESMNAVIYLDRKPSDEISGMVIKVNNTTDLDIQEQAQGEQFRFKIRAEAKPIDLNTEKISEKINEISHKIDSLKIIKKLKEVNIEGLKNDIAQLEKALQQQEVLLADKKAVHKNIGEQAKKIKDEEEIILLELSEVEKELEGLGAELINSQSQLSVLEGEQHDTDSLILSEQNNISLNNGLKEAVLVLITQTKTEIEALSRKIGTDEATLKILEDTFNQDQAGLKDLDSQISDAHTKEAGLQGEITALEDKILRADSERETVLLNLKEKETLYAQMSDDSSGVFAMIEGHRKELDALKDKLYGLQMQNKDVDFKYTSLKDRLLQGYKVDLEILEVSQAQPQDENSLSSQIQGLKEKLDSYGTVNLVAIEEYDELKKRYDFLTQQQADLFSAKESLHNAILKINRTTKQMFMETFEKVKVEFRNYFRLLFNGGDAQLFLIDENDPLESGIEIICRPPGKKLQNVLLLSGGEKAMSAIALIFAIFKIKPAPFCVLDEIDAALDEANVDRYSRMLHEFSQISQFIVITHNKKTIANADVMYGITMQESGVSKIVSVKFSKDKPKAYPDKEPDLPAVAEPV